MKKLGVKIIGQFLLLIFLAISFPVHELFHDHEVISCVSSKEHRNVTGHKKCPHKVHYSKKEKHICFYTYFNTPYIATRIINIFFKNNYFSIPLIQEIEKKHLFFFQYYLLRGPPIY